MSQSGLGGLGGLAGRGGSSRVNSPLVDVDFPEVVVSGVFGAPRTPTAAGEVVAAPAGCGRVDKDGVDVGFVPVGATSGAF